MRNLSKLLKDNYILGLTNVEFEKDRICSACQARKQVGVPHPPKSIMTTTQPLELIHMDLFGSVAYLSFGSDKYGLVIVDNYSRFTWVFFVYDKCQLQDKVKTFIRRAQREFGLPIKKVRSDMGVNSRTPKLKNFLMNRASNMSFQFHTPLNKMV
jgi:hypothetical protein